MTRRAPTVVSIAQPTPFRPNPTPKPRIVVLLIYLRAAPTKTYELALSILFYISIEERERIYLLIKSY
jgi:hypothetical protein